MKFKKIYNTDYGKMALDRLYNKYGPMYELPDHLSKNYMRIAQTAFDRFVADIRDLEPELMSWFNQDKDYPDGPNFEELNKTDSGQKMITHYAEFGWTPPMTSDPKDDSFMIYRLTLRLLKRAGAEVPNHYISEDRNFKVENLLQKPTIREAFIKEIAGLSHDTILKFMPTHYLEQASNDEIDQYIANKNSK
jgi:hypothetical protein